MSLALHGVFEIRPGFLYDQCPAFLSPAAASAVAVIHGLLLAVAPFVSQLSYGGWDRP